MTHANTTSTDSASASAAEFANFGLGFDFVTTACRPTKGKGKGKDVKPRPTTGTSAILSQYEFDLKKVEGVITARTKGASACACPVKGCNNRTTPDTPVCYDCICRAGESIKDDFLDAMCAIKANMHQDSAVEPVASASLTQEEYFAQTDVLIGLIAKQDGKDLAQNEFHAKTWALLGRLTTVHKIIKTIMASKPEASIADIIADAMVHEDMPVGTYEILVKKMAYACRKQEPVDFKSKGKLPFSIDEIRSIVGTLNDNPKANAADIIAVVYMDEAIAKKMVIVFDGMFEVAPVCLTASEIASKVSRRVNFDVALIEEMAVAYVRLHPINPEAVMAERARVHIEFKMWEVNALTAFLLENHEPTVADVIGTVRMGEEFAQKIIAAFEEIKKVHSDCESVTEICERAGEYAEVSANLLREMAMAYVRQHPINPTEVRRARYERAEAEKMKVRLETAKTFVRAKLATKPGYGNSYFHLASRLLGGKTSVEYLGQNLSAKLVEVAIHEIYPIQKRQVENLDGFGGVTVAEMGPDDLEASDRKPGLTPEQRAAKKRQRSAADSALRAQMRGNTSGAKKKDQKR